MNGKRSEEGDDRAKENPISNNDRKNGIASMAFWGLLLVVILYLGWQGKMNNDEEQAKYDEKAERLQESVDMADRKIEEAKKRLLR